MTSTKSVPKFLRGHRAVGSVPAKPIFGCDREPGSFDHNSDPNFPDRTSFREQTGPPPSYMFGEAP